MIGMRYGDDLKTGLKSRDTVGGKWRLSRGEILVLYAEPETKGISGQGY